MKTVITSDTHFTVNLDFIPDGDVFIHCGDLMTSGYPDEWALMLKWLAKLPHKHRYFIPGNHDKHIELYPGPALQDLYKIGVTVVGLPGNDRFNSVILPNGMSMLGLPYVTRLPRWAFNRSEDEIADHLKYVIGKRHDIVISHAPIKGYLDDVSHYPEQPHHVGIRAYKEYFWHHPPTLWCHGHIHEGYGSMVVNNCSIYNVAMCDRNHNHVNPPIVLDL